MHKPVRILFTLLFLLAVSFSGTAQEDHSKRIAVVFDNMPISDVGVLSRPEKEKLFYDMLASLEKYNITTVGFVTGKFIRNWDRILLREFLEKGHSIGNHTFTNFSLSFVTAEKFIHDINLCEEVIDSYIGQNKYFSYPFMQYGDTPEKRDSVQTFLEDNNYTTVPISIPPADPTINTEYLQALNQENQEAMQAAADKYLQTVKNYIVTWQQTARRRYDRNVDQIMLISVSLVSLKYLDTLLEWLDAREWEFITVNEALEDPIYKMEVKKNEAIGQPWLRLIN